MVTNKLILNQLSGKLHKIGNELGFHEITVRSNGCISEIYVVNKHALQLEIDWHENNLFMYAVYLKNRTLPNESIVYRYRDGQWCRKYLEEIYNTTRLPIRNHNIRYSPEYLFDCFEFYMQLIGTNPMILKNFGEIGNIEAN